MHIPDGYLSPETCAALYLTSAPFWYLALNRVKKLVSTQFLPLISLFAAFSFVVMMFNLPLPGGTTGHAVGMGVATVVLGPWASILAISVALIIQALFFGDGGVTAIGANCFNMAIVGSFVAYTSYRIVANRSSIGSRRRVVAAAMAGYAAINVSALFAAVEFGIQPIWFHDAAGVPLYCPYPLSVSIPAMMIGHLTFAGLAELILTAGVVAYLQRAEPSLLQRTASDAPDRMSMEPAITELGTFQTLRRFWLGLALLVVVTPLGILAAGTAWGEWSVQDFAHAPRGLARLSSIWNAPLARYSPSLIKNASIGYLVSAIVGVCLIVLILLAANWAMSRMAGGADGKIRRGFVERTVTSLVNASQRSVFAEEIARRSGVLQRLDPRVKVAGIGSLIVAAVAVHSLPVLALLFCVAVFAASWTGIALRTQATRVLLPALSFSGMVAVPVLLFARHGLAIASLLVLRVETIASLTALLVLTTEWMRVLRALRFFRVPVTAVVILGMTHRYVFLLLRTAQEMFESRQSRLVGKLESHERRRLAGATVGVLVSKSIQLSGEVHSAMLSRGFQGEVYMLDEPGIGFIDYLQLAVLLSFATATVILGH